MAAVMAATDKTLKLTLVTPEKKLLAEAEVEEIFVPGYRGELNILPGHAPLMTTLSTGVVKYRLKGQTELKPIIVSWGYCEVNPNGVVVLAETAERPEDIDQDRALAAWKLASEQLDSGSLDPDAAEKYRRKKERADLRKSVANNVVKGNQTSH
jgi:F-type H+-transporting ATPase subunit epsilon